MERRNTWVQEMHPQQEHPWVQEMHPYPRSICTNPPQLLHPEP